MLGLRLCVELLLRNGPPHPPVSLILDDVDNLPESHLLWIFDSEINNAVAEVEIRSSGGDSFLPFLCKKTYLHGAVRWPLPKLKSLRLLHSFGDSGRVIAQLIKQRYTPDLGGLANTFTPGSQTPLIVETPDRLTFLDAVDIVSGSNDYYRLVRILGTGVVEEYGGEKNRTTTLMIASPEPIQLSSRPEWSLTL
ncbi:hypothetical protein FS837_000224 [Tulasnella sp. UAMH 9824]|nr:hypothetical protein FS837_000224 [Tulasnella sp. UAMH 9824]